MPTIHQSAEIVLLLAGFVAYVVSPVFWAKVGSLTCSCMTTEDRREREQIRNHWFLVYVSVLTIMGIAFVVRRLTPTAA
jgi:hypothetical protein